MKNKLLLATIALIAITIKTQSQTTGTFTDSRDGKVYKTVRIGTQTWMAENFAYKASNGCFAYKEDETNVAKYGYLYNWETAKVICPAGWHLPSDAEWTTLINNLGGVSIAGEKMKSKIGWNDDDNKSGNGTNTSGFTALPGGVGVNMADLYNSFDLIGTYGIWWSATVFNKDTVWSRTIFNKSAKIHSDKWEKNCFLSVRYIKNSTDQGTGSIAKSATNSKDQTQKSFTDPRDGKVYKTVTIGTQTWMAENLAYKASSGCWAYNNDENNISKYGFLYNKEASIIGCPSGWHLPSMEELGILIKYLGGEDVAGAKLNDAGFSPLLGGHRSDNGQFYDVENFGEWWVGGWTWQKTKFSDAIFKSAPYAGYGYSVRCIKDIKGSNK